MWKALRHRQLEECKFYRQYPITPYIADFYCHTLKLVIEIDGDVHAGNRLKDEQRDTFMEQKGIRILRLTNRQVLYEWNDVLSEIAATIHELQAHNTDSSPSDE